MITILVIPAGPTSPIHQRRIDPADLPAMEKIVGGILHPVSLTNPESSLYLPAADIRSSRPCNQRATVFAAFHTRPFRPQKILRGDALLTGPTTPDGQDTDVPGDLIRLFYARAFRVQTKQQGTRTWTKGHLHHDLVRAYTHACEAVRGIPDDDLPLIRIIAAADRQARDP
ncbi:hypothetical protein CC117_25725 [Parafrankia colletiae]|uniref:DUF3846 domain-containing protein n=1 Tax=Parafrankia colletiae TaxID=573497 RepID=A0A1S1QD92_9ACTN|nr:hypothetical protein [Parafrankia colletiae]MCK9903590.1 hypothetical protein [Frankia sp. Cpl3]OHV31617.1 hypothetical protein CC117_25725 [Parafrankia colletiae]